MTLNCRPGSQMAKDPPRDDIELEIICSNCGYHLVRTAGRLLRDTPLVCPNCGAEITRDAEQGE